jgi:hypothetical protein
VHVGYAGVIIFADSSRKSENRRAKQREMLQDFARNLKDMIPSAALTLARTAQHICGIRGATETMDIYGPSKAGRIVSFLEIYPNIFELQGSGPNIKVFVAKPPEPRPVQCGWLQ